MEAVCATHHAINLVSPAKKNAPDVLEYRTGTFSVNLCILDAFYRLPAVRQIISPPAVQK